MPTLEDKAYEAGWRIQDKFDTDDRGRAADLQITPAPVEDGVAIMNELFTEPDDQGDYGLHVMLDFQGDPTRIRVWRASGDGWFEVSRWVEVVDRPLPPRFWARQLFDLWYSLGQTSTI